jgi:hypothetical protein
VTAPALCSPDPAIDLLPDPPRKSARALRTPENDANEARRLPLLDRAT